MRGVIKGGPRACFVGSLTPAPTRGATQNVIKSSTWSRLIQLTICRRWNYRRFGKNSTRSFVLQCWSVKVFRHRGSQTFFPSTDLHFSYYFPIFSASRRTFVWKRQSVYTSLTMEDANLEVPKLFSFQSTLWKVLYYLKYQDKLFGIKYNSITDFLL